jgi:hypothetical protein
MRSRRDYLGTGFAVWTGELTWFWRVLNSHHSGGAVGAAASEAEAVREACIAIEEMSALSSGDAPSSRLTTGLFFESAIACQARREDWVSRLERVAEYLRECS